MPVRHILLAVAVAVVWGANFVVIDAGLGDLPPLTFVALRFLFVLVPAIFFVPRPAIRWRDLAAVGLLMSVAQFGLLYTSLHLGMPPGLASLVLQIQVMLTVVIAALALHERPSVRQQVGVLVGLAGLAVVAVGRSASTPLVALLLCVAAALAWASGNVVARRIGSPSGIGLTIWSALFVPGPILALSLLIDGPAAIATGLRHAGWATLASTLYTAYLSSVFGYGVWNSLLGRHPATAVVPFTLLVPVSGIATAWVVTGETPTLGTIVGGLLLMLGVLVTVVAVRRRRGGGGRGSGGRASRGRPGSDAEETAELVA
ncbi:MAG: EamA family transporter [Lapillicoccus sp.]